MIKRIAILCLLLLCCGCVSRTVSVPDDLTGEHDVVVEKELLWFWDAEFWK